ncbi:MAG: PEGA domain-containing protein [Methanoregula sp.]
MTTGATASSGIQAYMGDTIPLSGYSYGSQSVYLFLTGPNLPANGVALDNIYARADEGHFTQVDVDSNDRWQYKWGTNVLGGGLDAGTYTIWVVNTPTDRSHLSEADYSTISVTFGNPGISLDTSTPAVPGTMVLSSSPNESSVVVNNDYKGSTPLTLSGLSPGTYTVTFSRFGYYPFSTPVRVESGAVSEVTASLERKTGGLSINTSPAGAQVMIDGANVGISPLTISNLPADSHTVNVSYPGYTSQEQTVTVIENQTKEITIVLSPEPPIPGIHAAGLVPATLLAGGIAALLVIVFRSRRQ